jgi:PKD repeat protein
VPFGRLGGFRSTHGRHLMGQPVTNPPISATAPTAAATFDSTSGASPLTIHVDATTSTPGTLEGGAGAAITQYSFNFGDGNIVSGSTPTASNTYASDGTFNFVLTVTSSNGLTATFQQSITVNTVPGPAFTLSADRVTADTPALINFTAAVTKGIKFPTPTLANSKHIMLGYLFGDDRGQLGVSSTWHFLEPQPNSGISARVQHFADAAVAAGGTATLSVVVVSSKNMDRVDVTGVSMDLGDLVSAPPLIAATTDQYLLEYFVAAAVSVEGNANETANNPADISTLDTSKIWGLLSDDPNDGHVGVIRNILTAHSPTVPTATTTTAFKRLCVEQLYWPIVQSFPFSDYARCPGGKPTNGAAANFTYNWAFGDGTSAVGASDGTASHTYTTAGTYTVTCRVTDAAGGVTSHTMQVTAAAVAADYPTDGVGGVVRSAAFFSGPGPEMSVANSPNDTESYYMGVNYDLIQAKPYWYPVTAMTQLRQGGADRGGYTVVLGYINSGEADSGEKPALNGAAGTYPDSWYCTMGPGTMNNSAGTPTSYPSKLFISVSAQGFGNWNMNFGSTETATVNGTDYDGWPDFIITEATDFVKASPNSLSGGNKKYGGMDGCEWDIQGDSQTATGRMVTVQKSNGVTLTDSTSPKQPQKRGVLDGVNPVYSSYNDRRDKTNAFNDLTRTRFKAAAPSGKVKGTGKNVVVYANVFNNGGVYFSSHMWDRFPHIDGGLFEGWLRDARNDGVQDYFTEAAAKDSIDAVADIGRRGFWCTVAVKIWVNVKHRSDSTKNTTTADLEALNRYCLAHFLLATDGNQYYCHTYGDRSQIDAGVGAAVCGWTTEYQKNGSTPSPDPMRFEKWCKNLGVPTVAFPVSPATTDPYEAFTATKISGGSSSTTVWHRAFTKGHVFVNPTANSLRIVIPTGGANYTDWTGSSVAPGSNYTMPANTELVIAR